MNYDVLRRDDGGGSLVAPAGAPAERLVVWEGLVPLPLPEHPSVASITFSGEMDGRRIYAERIPRGVRLDDVDLPPGVAEYVVVRILEGVAHLHKHRVVHGTVSRARVHLGTNGEVVLCGRGRKGGMAPLDLVAAVGLLPGPSDETLPGESAELAAAELSRRVPPGAGATLGSFVASRLPTNVPIARVVLGPPPVDGTDEVVPDLGPDSGHGILDRWGSTTATGNTGETTPAARTDSGTAAPDLHDELWRHVDGVLAVPLAASATDLRALREVLAAEHPSVLPFLGVIDAPTTGRSRDEFGDEPPTAVRRAMSLPPIERVQARIEPAPSRFARIAELMLAVVFGAVFTSLVAWLWP